MPPTRVAQERVRARLAEERAQALEGASRVTRETVARCRPPDPTPPGDPDAARRYRAALEALERDDPEAAETELRLALTRADRHAPTWIELGILLVESERWEEALRPLEEAARLDPQGCDAFRFLGIARERLGRVPEAIAAWRAALEVCPRDHDQTRRLAVVRLEGLERASGAVGSRRSPVPSAGPGFAPSRVLRCRPPGPGRSSEPEAARAYAAGAVAAEAGDMETAEAEFRRSLARDDGDPAPWKELGVLLVDAQRFEEALRPLETARSLDPGDPDPPRLVGLALDRLGRWDEAAVAYRRFMELVPEDQQRLRVQVESRLAEMEAGGPPGLPEPEVEELEPAPWWSRWVPGLGVTGAVVLLLSLWGSLGPRSEEAPPEIGGLQEFAHEARLAFGDRAILRREILDRARVPDGSLPLSEALGLLREVAEVPGYPARRALESLLRHASPELSGEACLQLVARAEPGARRALGRFVGASHDRRDRPPVEAAVSALASGSDSQDLSDLVAALAVGSRPPDRPRWLRSHLALLKDALAHGDPEVVASLVESRIARLDGTDGAADARVKEELRSLRSRFDR